MFSVFFGSRAQTREADVLQAAQDDTISDLEDRLALQIRLNEETAHSYAARLASLSEKRAQTELDKV